MADKCTIWERRLKGAQSRNKDDKGKKTLRGYTNHRPIIGERVTTPGTGAKEITIITFIIKTTERESTPKPIYRDLKKQQQNKERRYFICDKTGHIACDCPEHKFRIKLNMIKSGQVEEIPSDSEKE